MKHLTNLLQAALAAAAIFALPHVVLTQSQIIVGWNFQNASFQADLGVGSNAGVGFGFQGDSSPTTVVECWDSESASVNDWDAGEYWYTESFSTTGYSNITLAFNQKSTLYGPGKTFVIEYSLDGSTWLPALPAYDCPQVYFCVNAKLETSLAMPAALSDKASVQIRWRYTGTNDTNNLGDRNIMDAVAVRGWPILNNGEFHVVKWDTLRNPANNQIESIRLTFEKDVNPSTINSSNIVVTGWFSSLISGTFNTNGNQVTFTPNSPIKPGERVNVSAKYTITSTTGENLHGFGCAFQTPGAFNQWATQAGAQHTVGTNGDYLRPYGAFVTPGDFDGDGDIDVVIGAQNLGSIGDPDFSPLKIWWNGGLNVPGNGSSGTMATIYSAGINCNARNMDAGDIDMDGDLDLIVSGCGTYVFYNNGNGTFTQGMYHMFNAWGSGMLELMDFDRDGDLDIVHAGGAYGWHENPGNGQFSAASYREITIPGNYDAYNIDWQAVTEDVDADGDMDMMVWPSLNNYTEPNLPFSAGLMINDGSMNFNMSVLIADPIDTVHYGYNVDMSHIQGKPLFEDMDGDGWKELITPTFGTRRSRIYTNGGSGEWTYTELDGSLATYNTSGSLSSPGFGPDLTRVFDFDGNGINDYYTPNGKTMFNQTDSTFIFHKMNTETAVNAQTGSFNWTYGSAPVADVNGDGKLDVFALKEINDLWTVIWQELEPTPPAKSINSYVFGGCVGMSADSLDLDTLFTSYAGVLTYAVNQTSNNGQTFSIASNHYLKMDPSPEGAGTSSASVTATDEAGGSVSISFSAIENNPILVVDTIIKSTQVETLDGSIELLFDDASTQTAPFTFVWSDTLTLSQKYSAPQGNLVNAPSGDYTLVFTDKYGCPDTLQILLEPLNTPPAIVTQPDSTAAPDGGPATPGSHSWITMDLTPHVTDVDGDVLSYTKTSTDPAGWTATVEIADGDTLLKVDFSPTGIGNDTVRIAVSDGKATQVATILIPIYEIAKLETDGSPVGEEAVPPGCADGVCRFSFTGGAGTRTIQFCDALGNDDFTIEFTGELNTTLPQGRYYICEVWDEIGSYMEFNPPQSVLIPCTRCD